MVWMMPTQSSSAAPLPAPTVVAQLSADGCGLQLRRDA